MKNKKAKKHIVKHKPLKNSREYNNLCESVIDILLRKSEEIRTFKSVYILPSLDNFTVAQLEVLLDIFTVTEWTYVGDPTKKITVVPCRIKPNIYGVNISCSGRWHAYFYNAADKIRAEIFERQVLTDE